MVAIQSNPNSGKEQQEGMAPISAAHLEFKRKLRVRAFAGVVMSTIALATCVLVFPMLMYFAQRLHSNVRAEVQFCKHQTRDFWKEVLDIEQTGDGSADRLASAVTMLRRSDPETLLDFTSLRLSRQVVYEQGCCTCHKGSSGKPGPPGRSGRDGENGDDGQPGRQGDDAQVPPNPPRLFPEQCPCEADQGPPGSKGPRGPPGQGGNDGPPGQAGPPGNNGKPGPKGPPGTNGQPGGNGLRGDPGALTPAASGPPGPPGRGGFPGGPGLPGNRGNDGTPGNPGSKGTPGSPGGRGRNGQPGGRGQPGDNGAVGSPGPCDHCPQARLAPGY